MSPSSQSSPLEGEEDKYIITLIPTFSLQGEPFEGEEVII
jgi:hypothetical protein